VTKKYGIFINNLKLQTQPKHYLKTKKEDGVLLILNSIFNILDPKNEIRIEFQMLGLVLTFCLLLFYSDTQKKKKKGHLKEKKKIKK
jgi:hypothetical protein